VRAIAIPDKEKATILECFKMFWETTNHNLVSIASDNEPAVDSEIVKDWCHEKKVSLKIINAEHHTAHAVIDRLIRTLRDMNTPEDKSRGESTDPKYRDFSIYRLKKLIGLYNTNRHSSTGHTPKEMDENRKWEEDWIVKKLYERENRRRISNFHLHGGDMVRVINPTYGRMGKKRYTVSPEKYFLHGSKGKMYVIMSQDGSAKVVPRWRLLDSHLNKQHKFAQTIGKGNSGAPKKIIDYDDGQYEVEWYVPDNCPPQTTWTTVKNFNKMDTLFIPDNDFDLSRS
jgi:hypothetical protein